MPYKASFLSYIAVGLILSQTACTSKSLHVTVHTPKGPCYVGKLDPHSTHQVKNWLHANQKLGPARLSYVGEDRNWVYLRMVSGSDNEVISFMKKPEGLGFSLSGMELSSEWR